MIIPAGEAHGPVAAIAAVTTHKQPQPLEGTATPQRWVRRVALTYMQLPSLASTTSPLSFTVVLSHSMQRPISDVARWQQTQHTCSCRRAILRAG
jgi:hypothetical protein